MVLKVKALSCEMCEHIIFDQEYKFAARLPEVRGEQKASNTPPLVTFQTALYAMTKKN